MASAVYQPSASQWASATVHLENRDEWRYFRKCGVRYVAIISGRSSRFYVVRADAGGCSCPWGQSPWSFGKPCSHRIAVELAALEADLIESRKQAPKARPTIEELWPSCWTDGCDNDPAPHSGGCHEHMNSEAF